MNSSKHSNALPMPKIGLASPKLPNKCCVFNTYNDSSKQSSPQRGKNQQKCILISKRGREKPQVLPIRGRRKILQVLPI